MKNVLTLPRVAYLALGSNLGDRAGHITHALRLLHERGAVTVICVATLYENAPMYVDDQPDFINTCAKIETTMRPHKLLEACLAVEETMGRVRALENGPRNIDIDVVLYEDELVDDEVLTIPHPGMLERDFVLIPLAEIAPDVVHPGVEKRIAELAAELIRAE